MSFKGWNFYLISCFRKKKEKKRCRRLFLRFTLRILLCIRKKFKVEIQNGIDNKLRVS